MNPSPHLLVVEDQPIIQQAHVAFLNKLNCRITLASNAEEAQGYLVPQIPLMKLYDLVLLDLGLPDLNGIELCEWLRRFYSPTALPIVAVTAFGAEKKEQCIKAGMQGYFTKPLTLTMYSDIVKLAVEFKTEEKDQVAPTLNTDFNCFK